MFTTNETVPRYEADIEGEQRWQYQNNAWAVFAHILVAAATTASMRLHAACARSVVRSSFLIVFARTAATTRIAKSSKPNKFVARVVSKSLPCKREAFSV